MNLLEFINREVHGLKTEMILGGLQHVQRWWVLDAFANEKCQEVRHKNTAKADQSETESSADLNGENLPSGG